MAELTTTITVTIKNWDKISRVCQAFDRLRDTLYWDEGYQTAEVLELRDAIIGLTEGMKVCKCGESE